MLLPPILLTAAVLFCLGAAVARAWRYARQPAHLRWELYPVAHERGRAGYGGSHLEEPEHWRQPRRPDHAASLRAMAAEVVLLEGVRRHNRPLWRWSWPFHLGVYLLLAWLLVMLVGGVLQASIGAVPAALVWGLDLLGFAALGLGLWGAGGLLWRRWRDPALRTLSGPAERAGLALWILYLGWTLARHAPGGTFEPLLAVAAGLVVLDPAPVAWPLAVEMLLGAGLLVMIPLTRQFHAVAKYFLYHRVRWDDAPTPPGSALERRLARALDFGVAWQAPHVAGARNWSEATAHPTGSRDGRPTAGEEER